MPPARPDARGPASPAPSVDRPSDRVYRSSSRDGRPAPWAPRTSEAAGLIHPGGFDDLAAGRAIPAGVEGRAAGPVTKELVALAGAARVARAPVGEEPEGPGQRSAIDRQ